MAKFPNRKFWDGKTVHVTTANNHEDRREVEIGLTPETAGALANLLRKQGGFEHFFSPLPEGLHELMVALDYVLVGDPASVAAHQKMTGLPRPRPFRATEVRDGE